MFCFSFFFVAKVNIFIVLPFNKNSCSLTVSVTINSYTSSTWRDQLRVYTLLKHHSDTELLGCCGLMSGGNILGHLLTVWIRGERKQRLVQKFKLLCQTGFHEKHSCTRIRLRLKRRADDASSSPPPLCWMLFYNQSAHFWCKYRLQRQT